MTRLINIKLISTYSEIKSIMNLDCKFKKAIFLSNNDYVNLIKKILIILGVKTPSFVKKKIVR